MSEIPRGSQYVKTFIRMMLMLLMGRICHGSYLAEIQCPKHL